MVERETRHGKNGWIFTARRESNDFDERSSNDQIRVDVSVRSSRDIWERGMIVSRVTAYIVRRPNRLIVSLFLFESANIIYIYVVVYIKIAQLRSGTTTNLLQNDLNTSFKVNPALPRLTERLFSSSLCSS